MISEVFNKLEGYVIGKGRYLTSLSSAGVSEVLGLVGTYCVQVKPSAVRRLSCTTLTVSRKLVEYRGNLIRQLVGLNF